MSPQTRTGLVAFAIAGALFLVIGAAVGALVLSQSGGEAGAGFLSRVSKPSATKEGADWTIGDLRAYLEKNGVETIAFGEETTVKDGVITLSGVCYGQPVVIAQHPDAKSARDIAGAKGQLAWGRFRIRLAKEQQDKARALLGQ